MIERRLHKHFTAAAVSGSGETFLVPSIQLCPTEPTIPFKRRRRRFPIKIAFAMLVSKTQGQTLKPVAIYLALSVLWSALSGIFLIP
jgi:ATP-dependent DNA helicase PIF1